MCTFSPLKQGGNQRTRKESTNLSQHERQLDFLIQPSASLATDDTSQEEMCSDQRSSPPPDSRYDSGQGQGQKLLPELSTDIPANFDPSFLARLSQQISDQDGDALSDLTLSPFPFFPTSGNLLPQPVNSGAEIPHHPSSTRKSLDLPVFEIGTTATSTSLHTSALFLPQTPPTQSCQCLAAVIFAVEEFETNCNTENRAELDSIIAYQKKAINCCRSMINCTSCTSKRENFVLLVFITEKIVAVCGQIVVLYSMKDGTPGTQAAPGLSSFRGYDRLLDDWDFDPSASSPSSGSLKPASTSMLSDWRELLLGDYELRAVRDLLADMKKVGGDVLGEMQKASLARAERIVCELEENVYIL